MCVLANLEYLSIVFCAVFWAAIIIIIIIIIIKYALISVTLNICQRRRGTLHSQFGSLKPIIIMLTQDALPSGAASGVNKPYNIMNNDCLVPDIILLAASRSVRGSTDRLPRNVVV